MLAPPSTSSVPKSDALDAADPLDTIRQNTSPPKTSDREPQEGCGCRGCCCSSDEAGEAPAPLRALLLLSRRRTPQMATLKDVTPCGQGILRQAQASANGRSPYG